MADPRGVERFDGSPDRGRAHDLAGVGDRTQTGVTGGPERRLERLGWVQGLLPAEPDPDNSSVAVLAGVSDHRQSVLERSATSDVR